MNTKKTENGKRKTENVWRKFLAALVLILSIINFPLSINAQARPVYDYGAIGLGQLLKRLNTTKSVMMIGAHPDDEDSALLAFLARGENARTAYLSLTRGDGGQNIIGKELFESLGVVRTEELLQARKLDGAQQFFTRAFDYGFSKTLAEAKEKWDEKVILCDTVRVIRAFRPLVVISRFSGTPADGHGQHQYSGYISPLAVKAAADPKQCWESVEPWQVPKFYVEQGFRSESKPTLKINTGEYDPLLGRSYAEIAAEGRSLHRTQEQGGSELKGDRFSGLNLIESKVPKVENEKSIFDGIDTNIASGISPAQTSSSFSEADEKAELSKISNAAKQALDIYKPDNPQKIVPILLEGLKSIAKIRRSGARPTPEISQKSKEFVEAIRKASGIRIDALADRETVAPDGTFQVTVKAFSPNASGVKFKRVRLLIPNQWSSEEIFPTEQANQGFFAGRGEIANQTKYFRVKVSDDAKLTEPYWLEERRQGDLFSIPLKLTPTLPFQPSLASAFVVAEINGTEMEFAQPIEYRYADSILGEMRRDLNIVPKIVLNLDRDLILVTNAEKSQNPTIVLSITNNSDSAVSGTVKLNLPYNWQAVADSINFSLNKKGEKTSIKFVIKLPTNFTTGNYKVGAQAQINGEIFTNTMNVIAYPHIQTHRFYTEAKTKVDVLDLKVAPVKVGYIMGSGDDVPDSIRQMNLTVDLLGEKDLASGDLAKYDVIVVGIRAYNVRQDLISNNQRILDYVKNGGTLIVQYQRPDYVADNLQPFPASQTDTQKTTAGTTARVVDETAKVTILDANSPVFNFPNKITDADFADWVQERNLYNFTTFDAKYTPLLESHDAGEMENKGGMVYAKVGKGNYVYTSYSFFRQLPAGVSGAYRLFANLLSLPKSK